MIRPRVMKSFSNVALILYRNYNDWIRLFLLYGDFKEITWLVIVIEHIFYVKKNEWKCGWFITSKSGNILLYAIECILTRAYCNRRNWSYTHWLFCLLDHIFRHVYRPIFSDLSWVCDIYLTVMSPFLFRMLLMAFASHIFTPSKSILVDFMW